MANIWLRFESVGISNLNLFLVLRTNGPLQTQVRHLCPFAGLLPSFHPQPSHAFRTLYSSDAAKTEFVEAHKH